MNKFVGQNFACPTSFDTLISRLFWMRLSWNFAQKLKNDGSLQMLSLIWQIALNGNAGAPLEPK